MRLAGLVLGLVATAAAQSPRLTITVLEGNGAINNIARRTAYAPVVQVLDSSNQPVAQVPVTFLVSGAGAGGRFGDGGMFLTVFTDQEGKAAGRGLVPNNTPGSFEIRVTTVHRGETVRATITQTNVAPVKAGSGNTRKLLVISLIAGAAAGGILAASGGSGTEPARPPATAPPGGVVTPGQPGFGPPQ